MKQKLLNLKSLLLLLLMTVSMGARAQEIPTFESLSKLAEAIEAGDVKQSSKVSVSFNNEITKNTPQQASQSIVLKEGDYTFELMADALCDEGWTVGGTLATKPGTKWTAWYSGVYPPTGGADKIYMLSYSENAESAWDNLTYTAPVPTYDCLSGLMDAKYTEPTVVNIKIDNIVTSCWFDAETSKYRVMLDGVVGLFAPATSDLGWSWGSAVSGTLDNVTWDPDTKLLTSETGFWSSLTYTPTTTYESLYDVFKAETNEHVTISNAYDVIGRCFKTDSGKYLVDLKNSGISLLIATTNLDWAVGGIITGSLFSVRWNKGTRFIYLDNSKDLETLTYTVPVPFNSLSELAEAEKKGEIGAGTMVSVWLYNEITDIYTDNNGTQFVVVKDGNNTFQLTANAQCSTNWTVGGILVGENWIAMYNGSYSDKHMLYSYDTEAWISIYSKVPVPINSLSELAELTENKMVSLPLNNEITKIAESVVYVKDGDSILKLGARVRCSEEWEVGGKLATKEGENWIAWYYGKDSDDGTDMYILYNQAADAWTSLDYTAPAPTYEFFEDLLNASSYDYVNVNNVYDVIAECKEVQADTYEVKLKNSGISLIITTKDLGWVAGGTVTGSLSNVGWDKDYRFIYLNSTEGLQYIAPFNSLSELAEAAKTGKIGPGTMVSVSLNNEITKIYTENDGLQFVVVKDGDYTFDLVARGSCSEEWKVGGTLATKEGENWTALISWYKENNYNLYNSAVNAWGNLDYTAPEVKTFDSLSDLMSENYTEPTVVNVRISDIITSIGKKEITLNEELGIVFSAPVAPNSAWEQGGKVIATAYSMGNLNWDPSTKTLTSDNVNIWGKFSYTAPPTYNSLEALLNAPSHSYVTVTNVNDIIEKCEKVRVDLDTYEVKLNSGISLIIHTSNLDWEAGGKLTESLSKVKWDKDRRIIYGHTTDYWVSLAYTAPIHFNSLSELAEYRRTHSIDGKMCSISVEGKIEKIDNFDEENSLQTILLKDGNSTFQLRAKVPCSSEWAVGGTLKGSNWVAECQGMDPFKGLHLLYCPFNTAWTSLEYTAPYIAVTVNDCGNASFCCGKALDFTGVEAVKAYMVTGETEESVTITEIKKVPANTGIFVVGEGGTYNIPVLDGDADDASANKLVATTEPKNIDGSENIWALSKNDGKLHPVISGTIGTGKAYLVSTINNTAAARGFVFVDDNDATSINSAATVKATGVAYNLAGQRVNANAKGIVIVNGKKFINK